MALQSQLFRGDPKLEAAAVSDSAHIVPGARGPHVVKVQQALIQVAGAAIEPDGVYGPTTAAAVADFKRKHQPQILNFAGKIDDIVGIKTMAALDARMAAKGGGLRLNFGLEVETSVDIVVNLIGAPGSSLRNPEEALEEARLLSHAAVSDPDPFNRKFLRHKSNNNLLFRVAHTTNEIGVGNLRVNVLLVGLIAAMLRGKDPSNGNNLRASKIFILGTSSGGRNAITFAGLMVQAGFRPHFVAAIDASFFQADTPDRPIIAAEPVAPIPTFPLSAAGPSAFLVPRIPNRHNFFQSQGNHAKRVLNPLSSDRFNFLFTSNMGGGLEEIHGQVDGFDNHLLTVGAFGPSDDNFHEECDAAGRRKAQDMVIQELRLP